MNQADHRSPHTPIDIVYTHCNKRAGWAPTERAPHLPPVCLVFARSRDLGLYRRGRGGLAHIRRKHGTRTPSRMAHLSACASRGCEARLTPPRIRLQGPLLPLTCIHSTLMRGLLAGRVLERKATRKAACPRKGSCLPPKRKAACPRKGTRGAKGAKRGWGAGLGRGWVGRRGPLRARP